MEPVSIAIIGTAVFGVTTSVAVFIRQLLLSRDQRLNEKAQERALEKETAALEKMRQKMESTTRFDAHYSVLDSNKDEIQYLDQKIENLLEKKFTLVKRYSELALKESAQMIKGQGQEDRKEIIGRLRDEIDLEIEFYDEQIKTMQQRRAGIWDTHLELQTYLVEQEQSRNKSLDELYHSHTSMLEKIYLRNIDKSEKVTIKSIDSGTSAMSLIIEPLKLLLQFLQILPSISKERAEEEVSWRDEVDDYEDYLNHDDEPSYNEEDEVTYDELPDWESKYNDYGDDYEDSESQSVLSHKPSFEVA